MRLVDANKMLEDNKELADCDFNHPLYGDTLRDVIESAKTVTAVIVPDGASNRDVFKEMFNIPEGRMLQIEAFINDIQYRDGKGKNWMDRPYEMKEIEKDFDKKISKPRVKGSEIERIAVTASLPGGDEEVLGSFGTSPDAMLEAKALYAKTAAKMKAGKSEYTAVSLVPIVNRCYRYDKCFDEYQTDAYSKAPIDAEDYGKNKED